jgi:hypothetical protein
MARVPKPTGRGADVARVRRAKGAERTARTTARVAQAWIESVADDPEAVSALAVARERLGAGRGLLELRRMRVFELSGALPNRAALEGLLHRSIQFYNPAKERCTLRLTPGEAPPIPAGEIGVLVVERGGERRAAAERWWRHETGTAAEIREGVAWALRLAPGARAEAVADLAILRGREHGLLCNPHWQDARVATGKVPLPWLADHEGARAGTVARGGARPASVARTRRAASAPGAKARGTASGRRER